jgi:hypothetical protein
VAVAVLGVRTACELCAGDFGGTGEPSVEQLASANAAASASNPARPPRAVIAVVASPGRAGALALHFKIGKPSRILRKGVPSGVVTAVPRFDLLRFGVADG